VFHLLRVLGVLEGFRVLEKLFMTNYNGGGGKKIAFGLISKSRKGIIFRSSWDVYGL